MDIGAIWEGWSEDENRLFQEAIANIAEDLGDAAANNIANDEWVHFLYHEAMWDWDLPGDYRGNAYEAFVQYMDETYGLEWEDYYDWEAFREAYDNA